MSNEASNFLAKVNRNQESIQDDISHRRIQATNDGVERERVEDLRKKEHSNMVEATKMEFIKLGVVGAFNEVINDRVLSIKDEQIVKSEPIRNIWGRKTGDRKVTVPVFVPAYIDYDEDSVRLVVEKHSENDAHSYSDYATVGCEQYILVKKEKGGIFSLGFYGTNGSGNVNQDYEEIKRIECGEDMLIENLAKLVAVYREIRKIEQKGDHRSLFHELRGKNLLPHFP
jgi:hypothetical protein